LLLVLLLQHNIYPNYVLTLDRISAKQFDHAMSAFVPSATLTATGLSRAATRSVAKVKAPAAKRSP
jgi:hypothetical protein